MSKPDNTRSEAGKFAKGVSGNPGGRPKALADVIELARSHTVAAITTLGRISSDRDAPPAAQIEASKALLERAWGKPVQHVSGDDGGPLQVIIRRLTATGA